MSLVADGVSVTTMVVKCGLLLLSLPSDLDPSLLGSLPETVITVVISVSSSGAALEFVNEDDSEICEGESPLLVIVGGDVLSAGGTPDPPVYIICSDRSGFMPSYDDITVVASLGDPQPHCEKPDQ